MGTMLEHVVTAQEGDDEHRSARRLEGLGKLHRPINPDRMRQAGGDGPIQDAERELGAARAARHK
jgi:hypothetical protein